MREKYIDYAKAFGMFAVVWGHIIYGNWTHNFVYSFSIPLFLFLSGYCYNSKKYLKLKDFVKARVKTLIIPYLIFGIVTYIWWIVYSLVLNDLPGNYLMPLLQLFVAQGSSGYLLHNVALWFVTCLFCMEIIYYLMQKLNDITKLLIGIVLAIAGYFMIQDNAYFDFTKLPFSLEVAASGMIFYITGNVIKERLGGHSALVTQVKKHKCIFGIVTICLFAALLLLSFYNGKISMGSNNLGKNVYVFYIAAYIGVCAVLLLSALLSVLSDKRDNFIVKYLSFVGKNSFYFMAIHVPLKTVIVMIKNKLILVLNAKDFGIDVYTIICFVVTMILTSFAVVIINKIHENHRKKVMQQ